MVPCHSCAPDSTPGRGLGLHHPREGWKRTTRCSSELQTSTVVRALGHTLPHRLASGSPLGASSGEQGSAQFLFPVSCTVGMDIHRPPVQYFLSGISGAGKTWCCGLVHTLERTSLIGFPSLPGRPNSLRPALCPAGWYPCKPVV